MLDTARHGVFTELNRRRKDRRVQTMLTFGLVVLGPVLALLTFLVLGPVQQGASSDVLRAVILADLVYILVVAAMVMMRVARMITDRRNAEAGSRLHLRLVGVFTFVALVPTVVVAIFATLSLNIGLEGWFSDRVRNVVGNSLDAAQAYEFEHRNDLTEDALALAGFLNQQKQATFFLTDGDLRSLLTRGQLGIQRGLREAYVIDSAGTIRARGERSYLFDFDAPAPDLIERAQSEGPQLIEDWPNNEFRALIFLDAYVDRFLYVSREVDGQILNLLDDTQETVRLYEQLESQRGRLLFEFAMLYTGFAVIMILAAIWFGLWFAERLSRPVGRLASAAQQVGKGNLDVQVPEADGKDEITTLGRIFNQMTDQLKGQRDSLIESNRQSERRRRLFDSVLSNVTSGVVGLDARGQVDFMNRSAQNLLGVEQMSDIHKDLSLIVPEFAPLFGELTSGRREAAQQEIKLTRRGKQESLLVRMNKRYNSRNELEGYVVAFDDVTDLVSAQRMAAWGDVARRIAHEIKNPLTPIQLSAERLKRKFTPLLADEAENLHQMTDVIIRQTNDLRRIVDEFSKFARMPEPERRSEDLLTLVRDATVLQRNALSDVDLRDDLPAEPVWAEVDATMISQALINLIKNAGEAIESLRHKDADLKFRPEILVELKQADTRAVITIADNGIGLPEDRAKLFEPYVTTRAEGTGLGLPIVKKIIEEHGGTLSLEDAPPFDETGRVGAMAVIELPLDLSGKHAAKNVA